MTASVVDWVREKSAGGKPWLLVGKGPTADFLCRIDLNAYHVCALNHACRLVPCDLAHFVDVEAYLACRHALMRHVRVALPWHPHVRFRPGPALTTYPELAELGRRLLSYNSSSAGKLPRGPGLPTLRLRHFGSVGAFNALVAAGVREVHSVGVDGGTGYAEGFDEKDRLANGRKSFDAQFPEMRQTAKRNRVKWVRLFEGKK